MIEKYFQEVADCLENTKQYSLDCAVAMILQCVREKGKIFIAGNGGSAAHSSHFAIDLLKAGSTLGTPIQAISLTDNVPILTATSNDIGYESVFSWQLEQYGNNKDCLIVISSSGNSPNVVNALKVAELIGMKSISISGFDGGLVSQIATVSIVTVSNIGNYEPVEDAHGIICHYIAKRLKRV